MKFPEVAPTQGIQSMIKTDTLKKPIIIGKTTIKCLWSSETLQQLLETWEKKRCKFHKAGKGMDNSQIFSDIREIKVFYRCYLNES